MSAPQEREAITTQVLLDNIREIEAWSPGLEKIINSPRGNQVFNFLNRAIRLAVTLEQAAQNPQANLPQTAEKATKVKGLWVKSAHGTYLQDTKEDRFKGKPWAVGNDRQRINYSLEIARSIAEIRSGKSLTGNFAEDKEVMMEYGPYIIYAGREDENRDLRTAASNPLHYFPADRVYPTERFYIIDGPIDNAADVIKNFRMPPTYHPQAGDEIGSVMHWPQAVRILFMLNQIENQFPPEATLRLFPMPVAEGGNPEYLLQELRGATFYRFISKPQLAASWPHRYIV